MGSSHQRLLAAAALVLAMSAIVGLVVLSPLVWRDGSSPGPAPAALPAQGEIAEVVAPKPAPPTAQEPKQPAVAQPAAPARAASEASMAVSARSGQPQSPERSSNATPPPPPAVDDVKKGKAKGHEKNGLGSKKAGKHGHHAQGAPGKGHGKGKSKDRDRAPARARG